MTRHYHIAQPCCVFTVDVVLHPQIQWLHHTALVVLSLCLHIRRRIASLESAQQSYTILRSVVLRPSKPPLVVDRSGYTYSPLRLDENALVWGKEQA